MIVGVTDPVEVLLVALQIRYQVVRDGRRCSAACRLFRLRSYVAAAATFAVKVVVPGVVAASDVTERIVQVPLKMPPPLVVPAHGDCLSGQAREDLGRKSGHAIVYRRVK